MCVKRSLIPEVSTKADRANWQDDQHTTMARHPNSAGFLRFPAHVFDAGGS